MYSWNTLLKTCGPRLLALGLAAGMVGCGAAGSDEVTPEAIERYPDRPITIVTWVTPGSPTDALARAIARVGPKYFGQQFQVLSRPGGSGAVAMSYLTSRPADGYTLGIMTSSGAITMAAGQIPFQPEQFTYLQRLQLDPLLIAVRANSPFNDMAGMYEHARANPGGVSMGGFGTTSIHFLSFSQLKEAAGNPDIRWIAYDGSSDAAVAVLGGHVDATDNNYSVVREHIRAGSMRVIGVSYPLDVLPDAATYQDQGYNVDLVHWRAVMGPAGMPETLAAKIHGLLTEAAQDPEFVRFMEESGNAYGLMDSQGDFQQWVLQQVRTSREALAELGMVPAGGSR